jgi:hypothetical protein
MMPAAEVAAATCSRARYDVRRSRRSASPQLTVQAVKGQREPMRRFDPNFLPVRPCQAVNPSSRVSFNPRPELGTLTKSAPLWKQRFCTTERWIVRGFCKIG